MSQNDGGNGGNGGNGGDGRVEAALRAALAEGGVGERDTIASLMGDAMRGQSPPLAWLTLVAQVALVVGAALSAVRFFGADTTKAQIMYAALFLFLMHAAGIIKSWFWMQIHRNRVLREVKRLELQVARLAEPRA